MLNDINQFGNLKSILKECGWDETLSFPSINSDNEEILKLIKLRNEQNKQNENDCRLYVKRNAALSSHLKSVREELKNMQLILKAKNQETKTEIHLTKVCEREDGRLKQEICKLEMKTSDTAVKCAAYERHVATKNAQLDNLLTEMKWGKETLETYTEEAEKYSDHVYAIDKYSKQDDTKICSLEAQMATLNDEITLKRNKLNQMNIEVEACQLELDKSAEEFRLAHMDRQKLIQQWEQTIATLKRRDTELENIKLVHDQLDTDIEALQRQLKQKEQFFTQQKDNNTQFYKKIKTMNMTLGNLNDNVNDQKSKNNEIKNELTILKSSVFNEASTLERIRSELSLLKSTIGVYTERLASMKKENTNLNEKLHAVKDAKLTAEERQAMANKEMADEENAQKIKDKQLKALDIVSFDKRDELKRTKDELVVVEFNLKTSLSVMHALNSRVQNIEKDSQKQHEVIYQQTFEYQRLERKIMNLTCVVENDDKMKLEAQIRELTNTFNNHNEISKIFVDQIKLIQQDFHTLKTVIEKLKHLKVDLYSRLEDLELNCNLAIKDLKIKKDYKEDLMIQKNLRMVERKRLSKILHSTTEGSVSLEVKALMLDTAMKERRLEIMALLDTQKVEARLLEEERQKISAEVHLRQSLLPKLKSRYDIAMMRLKMPDDDSPTFMGFVVKIAQEKQELQEHGDKLNLKLAKMEKEIQALENTLLLFNCSNEQQRLALHGVEKESLDLKDNLIDIYRGGIRKLRQNKSILKFLKSEQDILNSTLSSYEDGITEKGIKLRELEEEVSQKRHENSEEILKVKRATSTVNKIRQVLTTTKGENLAALEADMRVCDLANLNNNIVYELNYQVGNYASEALPQLQSLLRQLGFEKNQSVVQTSKAKASLSHSKSGTSTISGTISTINVGEDNLPSPPCKPNTAPPAPLTVEKKEKKTTGEKKATDKKKETGKSKRKKL